MHNTMIKKTTMECRRNFKPGEKCPNWDLCINESCHMIICDNTRHDNTMTISIVFLLGISVHQVRAMFEYGKNELVDDLAPDATSSDEGLTNCCCAIMGLSS